MVAVRCAQDGRVLAVQVMIVVGTARLSGVVVRTIIGARGPLVTLRSEASHAANR